VYVCLINANFFIFFIPSLIVYIVLIIYFVYFQDSYLSDDSVSKPDVNADGEVQFVSNKVNVNNVDILLNDGLFCCYCINNS
jgi:hypothetical protein